jgi:hypothetical protein
VLVWDVPVIAKFAKFAEFAEFAGFGVIQVIGRGVSSNHAALSNEEAG